MCFDGHSYLASEVKFELRGQRSFKEKVMYLISDMTSNMNISIIFSRYESLKFSFWPPRSNLTSEVKGHFGKKITEKVSSRYLKRF